MGSHPALHCEPLARGATLRAHNRLVLDGLVLDPRVDRVTGEVAGLSHAAQLTEPPVEVLNVADGTTARRFQLTIDTSGVDAGGHLLTLTAVAGGETVETVEATVDLLPYEPAPGLLETLAERLRDGRGAMWCESFPPRGSAWPVFELRGWAAGGVERVIATLDGRHRFDLGIALKRPDVAEALGLPDLDRCGFLAELDVRGQHPGEHALTVVACFADGSAMGQESVVVFGTTPDWASDGFRVDGDDPPPFTAAAPVADTEVGLPRPATDDPPSATEVELRERLARAVAEAQADRTIASLERAARERAEEMLQQALEARERSERRLSSILASRSWRLASALRRAGNGRSGNR